MTEHLPYLHKSMVSIRTYRNDSKYRDHLSITKDVYSSLENQFGKMVVVYGHHDLILDSLDGSRVIHQNIALDISKKTLDQAVFIILKIRMLAFNYNNEQT